MVQQRAKQATRDGTATAAADGATVIGADAPSSLIPLREATAIGTGNGHASEEVAETVLDTFEGQLDGVVAETWQQLVELPGYRDLNSVEADAVRGALRCSIMMFVCCLRKQNRLSGQDREFYRSLGADRAWKGIPFDALETAFQTGYQRAHIRLDQIAHDHPDPAASAVGDGLTARLLKLFPDVLAVVRNGYQQALAGRLLPHHVAQQQFVADMVDSTVDQKDAWGRLRQLAIQPPERWQPVIVVGAHDPQADLVDAVEAVRSVAPDAVAGAVHDQPTSHVVVLVPVPTGAAPTPDDQQLDAVARQHQVTLVSAGPSRLEQIGPACHRLRANLDLVSHVAPYSKVLSARELMRHAILIGGSRLDAEWFVGDVLAPVVGMCELRWDPLATVCAVHDAGGDLAAAGAKLGLAERTVRRRVRHVADLLGTSRDDAVSGCDVAIALRLLRLHGDTFPPPGDRAWSERYG